MKKSKVAVDKQCEQCKKQFQTHNLDKKFCSASCASTYCNLKRYAQDGAKKHHKYERQCDFCGKTYTAYSANKDTKFCSRECSSEHKRVTYKGRKLTPEWLSRMNAAKTRDKVVKYGEFTCPKCNKVFDTNLSLRSHTSYCNNDEKCDVTCHICGKTFKRQRGLTTHIALHHDEERNRQHKETVSNARCSSNTCMSTSAEELKFLEHLKALYPDVQHKFKFEGCKHEFDFYVPSKNLIVEYDGDYWHGNPNTMSLTETMKRQYQIDARYTKMALNAGYDIHRVWASEAGDYPVKVRTLHV